jgi:hypothetical protein
MVVLPVVVVAAVVVVVIIAVAVKVKQSRYTPWRRLEGEEV